MTADLIEGNINEMGVLQEEEIIINSVGAFFAAGTDTVSSTLSTVLPLDLRIGQSISPVLTFPAHHGKSSPLRSASQF